MELCMMCLSNAHTCNETRKVIYPGWGTHNLLLAYQVLNQLSFPSRQLCLRLVPIHQRVTHTLRDMEVKAS